jgi:hypothetical protein
MFIQSNRLQVEVLEPSSIYRRARFDQSAICRSVILDKKTEFCSIEASGDNRGTEGIGLSSEFGLQTPIGFATAPIGGLCPKIGVGFLTRPDDQPYNFMRDYAITPDDITVKQASDAVSFVATSRIVNGYGWVLTKQLRVDEANLQIDYRLRNTGALPLVTEEYCHNFLNPGGIDVGSGWSLELSFPLSLDTNAPDLIKSDASTLSLAGSPATWFYASQVLAASPVPITWRLVNSRAAISGRENFPVIKFALWGMRHVISPEFFMVINLLPGEQVSWQRTYSFESKS